MKITEKVSSMHHDKIAEHLENKALKRQNLNIQLNFEARNEVYR